MARQVTASKTGLLLRCARPFDPATPIEPREPTEAMKYGSCIHKLLELSLKSLEVDYEGVCSKWGVEDVEGAKRHLGAILEALKGFMQEGGNPFGVKFGVLFTEVPYATLVAPKSKNTPPRTRECGFDAETHTYDLREGELGGTYDILLYSKDWGYIVVDLKTGSYGDWTQPNLLPQMQTLVLQSRLKFKRGGRLGRFAAAILHSEKDAPPVIYCEEIGAAESAHHLKVLRAAMGRIGDGSLTPGEWCAKCPALEGCPANDGNLLARSESLVKAANTELMTAAAEPGKLHMFLQQFEALAKRARELLREQVEGGAVITRPDGKTLAIREVEKESLSKASVIEALGKEEGERLIEELRSKGAVKSVVSRNLVAVSDK